MHKTISLLPRLNEKTYSLSTSRVFVFNVEKNINKHDIAKAVEAQFDVKVVHVNTVNISGKEKRIVSLNGKRMKNAQGSRSDMKKAYVTLAEGNSLPFFDAVEESEKKEKAVQEKLTEKLTKETAAIATPRRGLHLPTKKSKAPKEDEK